MPRQGCERALRGGLLAIESGAGAVCIVGYRLI
jgi:hypothetical protein